MATAKQIEANRRNAQKSTGPKTQEGKAASRFNAVRHGLRASQLALPHEDPEEVQGFVDALIEAIAPRDAFEAELAADIATLSWKLRRAERYEHAYLAKRMMALSKKFPAGTEEEMGWELDLAAFDDDAAGQRRRRYMSGIRSALSRTRRELSRWRADHPVAKLEPEPEPEPQTPEPVATEPAVEKPPATPAIEDISAPGIGFVRPGGDTGYIDFTVGRGAPVSIGPER